MPLMQLCIRVVHHSQYTITEQLQSKVIRMRKWTKRRTSVLVVILGLLTYVFWPRSIKRMERIAEYELQDEVQESIVRELGGPLIYHNQKYAEFVWYKVLEWGDTSKIFISVHRSIFSCDRYDSWWRNFLCYLEPSVTMNYAWNYVGKIGASNFEEIFPEGAKGIEVMSSVEMKGEGFDLIVPTERLIYFLKKGYFSVLQQEQKETTILFYEPIANVYLGNKKDTATLMTAKALANDSVGIFLIPYDYFNVIDLNDE